MQFQGSSDHDMCTKHDDDPFGVLRPDIVLVNKIIVYKQNTNW